MAFRLTFLSIIIMVTACPQSKTLDSKEVKSDAIVRQYAIEHDSTSKELTFRAQFRNGSYQAESLRLSRPSYVEVEGNDLYLRDGDSGFEFNGSYYYRRIEVDEVKAAYEFRWTKEDNEVVVDKVDVLPEFKFSNVKEGMGVLRTRDLVLKMSRPLADDETIELVGEQSGSGEKLIDYTPGESVYTIKKEYFDAVPTGKHSLSFRIETRNPGNLREDWPLETRSSILVTVAIQVLDEFYDGSGAE